MVVERFRTSRVAAAVGGSVHADAHQHTDATAHPDLHGYQHAAADEHARANADVR
jgi:hypothetical protein